MRNDDKKSGLIFSLFGIIPVIWIALLTAPYLAGGLPEILQKLPDAMNHPYHIRICGDSVKTVLIFLLRMEWVSAFMFPQGEITGEGRNTVLPNGAVQKQSIRDTGGKSVTQIKL